MVVTETDRFGKDEPMSCEKCNYSEMERMRSQEEGINLCHECPKYAKECSDWFMRKKDELERISKRK